MNKGAQKKKAAFIAGLRMQLLTTAPQHTAGLGGEIRLNSGNPCQFCTLDVDRSTLFEFQKVKTQWFYWKAISQLFETDGCPFCHTSGINHKFEPST